MEIKVNVSLHNTSKEEMPWAVWIVDHNKKMLHRHYRNGVTMDIPFLNWEPGEDRGVAEPPVPDVMTITRETAKQVAAILKRWIEGGEKYIFLPARVVKIEGGKHVFGETYVGKFIEEAMTF